MWRGWSNGRWAELVAQPIVRCCEVGGVGRRREVSQRRVRARGVEVGNPLPVRSRRRKDAVEDIVRHRRSRLSVLRHPAAARPGSQTALAHEPLDAVQAAGEALGQHVVPNPPGTVGPVAALETPGDDAEKLLVVL